MAASRTYRSSLLCHATILLGGAVGGWVSLLFVAFWVVPGAYPSPFLTALEYACLGLFIGYLPGIGTYLAILRFQHKKLAIATGSLISAVAATLVCGPIAMVLGIGAFV